MGLRHFITGCLLGTFLSVVLNYQTAQAEVINWRNNLDAAKIEASQSGRFVLLHFWTPSCGPCKLLERDVFSQPQLGAVLEKDFVPVKVNADLSPAMASAYRIDRVPTDILLSPQGTPLARLTCPNTADAYTSQLTKAAQHFRAATATQQTPQQPPVQSAYAGLRIGQHKQAFNTTPPTSQPQARPAASAPAQPAVTNNPYAAQKSPETAPATAQAPATTTAPAPAANPAPNRYAASVPPRPAASVPAGTMPNSYRNQPTVQAAPSAQTPPTVATPNLDSSPTAQRSAVQTTSAQSAPRQEVNISLPQQPTAAPATAQPVVVTKAAPPKLPSGTPPVAFDGYCAVSLKYEQKWIAGKLEYGAYHRGRTFLFAGLEQQQQFLASPDAYCPVFSGLDVVKMLESNEQIEGSRKYGFKYLNAFYLFSSQESMARFAANPSHYAAGVRQAMTRMDASTSGMIRR